MKRSEGYESNIAGLAKCGSKDSRPPSCLFDDLLQDCSLFPDCDAGLGCFHHYLSEARVEVDRGNFSFYGNDFSNVRLGFSFWQAYGLVRSDDDSLVKEVNDLRHNIVLFSKQTNVLYVYRKSWPFEFYTSYFGVFRHMLYDGFAYLCVHVIVGSSQFSLRL